MAIISDAKMARTADHSRGDDRIARIIHVVRRRDGQFLKRLRIAVHQLARGGVRELYFGLAEIETKTDRNRNSPPLSRVPEFDTR